MATNSSEVVPYHKYYHTECVSVLFKEMSRFSIIEHVSVYHGAISKATTEMILGAVGRDGSYLLRDSESLPNTYCLCVLCKDVVYTYRMFQINEGSWTVEENKPWSRDTIIQEDKESDSCLW
ncbi:unnamed protein product [Oncorhynchus mykiss]|uniref:SH2 domain-containing protein n=1 Tax=Oncorhynchus mykiss TaxID=8022 RepID=A0A060W4E0_ONCMY|nr:unnamed protein product [Oncorhynchus mykiss]